MAKRDGADHAAAKAAALAQWDAKDSWRMAAAVATISDLFQPELQAARAAAGPARVTLVIRRGGTGEHSDDMIASDDDLGAVAAALLHAAVRAGGPGG
jgi:cytochrome P450